jgi:chromosome segregation ATPase
MKNKFLVLVAIVATVMFTSCKPKLSEETKKGIADFKNDWTAMTGSLSAFGDTLNADMKKEDDTHKLMGEQMGDTSKMKKDAKAKVKETMAACQANVEKLKAIQKTYSDYKTGIDTVTTSYTDFSGKAEKSEVTEEQAKTAMDGYHKNLDDSKAKIGEWSGALNALMAEEMKNHQECMDVCMPKKAAAGKPAAGKPVSKASKPMKK